MTSVVVFKFQILEIPYSDTFLATEIILVLYFTAPAHFPEFDLPKSTSPKSSQKGMFSNTVSPKVNFPKATSYLNTIFSNKIKWMRICNTFHSGLIVHSQLGTVRDARKIVIVRYTMAKMIEKKLFMDGYVYLRSQAFKDRVYWDCRKIRIGACATPAITNNPVAGAHVVV